MIDDCSKKDVEVILSLKSGGVKIEDFELVKILKEHIESPESIEEPTGIETPKHLSIPISCGACNVQIMSFFHGIRNS